jgi:putative copper export protein
VTTLSALIRFAHLAAAAFLLGSLAFQYFVAHKALAAAGANNDGASIAFEERELIRARWTLLAVFVTGLLAFWLQIAAVNGVPLLQALRPESAGGVLLGTRYGVVWLVRVGLMAFLTVSLFSRQSRSSNYFRVLSLCLATALLVALAFSSHAAAGEGGWLAAQLTVYGLHLFAAGLWLGGLPALALFLGWMRRADGPWLQMALKETTRRFSLLGLGSVTILIASGVFNAWNLVGSIPPLVGTTYGKLLLVKIALLLPLLGVAAVNLRWLKPRIARLGNSSGVQSQDLLGRLKRLVITEAAFGAGILLIVGFMSITPPARHVQPEWPFASRWNLNLLDSSSAKIRAQLTQAKW